MIHFFKVSFRIGFTISSLMYTTPCNFVLFQEISIHVRLANHLATEHGVQKSDAPDQGQPGRHP